jgi:RNA polymerase sigma factor (sigma-70 family)
MGASVLPPTSPSLLGRLRASPTDEPAWREFVLRYAGAIYSWCREWGLQDADAQDVSQAVLARLAVRMKTFHYDPTQSFRHWLWTVSRHAWADLHADRDRAAVGTGTDEASDRLQTVAARDDLLARLSDAFDLELLDEAYDRVRARVAPTTWEAFRLTAVEHLSGADVAARLGISVASVFMAKSNVQKMLRDDVRRLGHDHPDE